MENCGGDLREQLMSSQLNKENHLNLFQSLNQFSNDISTFHTQCDCVDTCMCYIRILISLKWWCCWHQKRSDTAAALLKIIHVTNSLRFVIICIWGQLHCHQLYKHTQTEGRTGRQSNRNEVNFALSKGCVAPPCGFDRYWASSLLFDREYKDNKLGRFMAKVKLKLWHKLG